MRTRSCLVCTAAFAAVLVAASSAGAANVKVDGHVIAPPSAKGSKVVLPLILSERSQRRLRLRTAVVRVVMPRHARLSAPASSGIGKTRIAAHSVRIGDHLRSRAKLSRKQAKRLRKRAVPTFRVRRTAVASRASALSGDELKRMIEDLGSRLTALSSRVDALSDSAVAGIASLRHDLDATMAKTNALTGGVSALELSFGSLSDELDLLTGSLPDPAELLALQGDVSSLLTRVGSLESVTDTLGGSLNDLTDDVLSQESSLLLMQGDLTPLMATVGDLGTRLGTAEGVVAQVPGLLQQVDGIDDALTSLGNRVSGAETLLETLDEAVGDINGSVEDLTLTVGTVSDTVTQQGLDLELLGGDVSALGTELTGLSGDLGALQSLVDTLDGAVADIDGDLTALQATVGIICGLPLITC